MPRLYLACPTPFFPLEVERLAAEGFATVVRLPLKSDDALAAVERQLALLSAQAPPVQLFLPRIKELHVSANLSRMATVLERHCKVLEARGDTRVLRADCGTRSFIVAEKTIPHSTVLDIINHDIAAEALPAAWEEWTGDAVVSVAVAATGDPLQPRLYNFLPMGEGAEAPFAGYLDAPFFSTLDRQRVQAGSPAECVSAGGRAPTGLGRCGARASLPAAQRSKAGGARSRVVEQERRSDARTGVRLHRPSRPHDTSARLQRRMGNARPG